MVWLVAWIAGLYLILKTVQWMVGTRGGYGEDSVALRAQVARGEPWFIIVAVALPVCVFAYGQWWAHRWATRGLAHAVDCIGQLGPADRLPGIYAAFRRSDIADSALSYNALALDQGRRLGIRQDQVYRVIDRRNRDYAASYADLAREGDAGKVADRFASIDRCIRDDWPHDELLNP